MMKPRNPLHCINRGAVLWLATLAISPAALADPPTYTAQLITPTISTITAAAMNEAGDVVGTSTVGSGGWISYAGTPAVFLPLPPGALYTFPTDINNARQIVVSGTNSVTQESGVLLLTPMNNLVGDLNCDGEIGFDDINPFAALLAGA